MIQPKEWECSNCGGPSVVARGDYKFTDSGLKNVQLVGVDLIKCNECGNVDPILPGMTSLMQCLARAVISKPWKLAGEEIRYLRKYLGMTADAFGKHLGVDKTTVSKWENDHDPISDTSDRLVRAVALAMGEGLLADSGEAVRKFPDIRGTARPGEYRYDTGTQEAEYVS